MDVPLKRLSLSTSATRIEADIGVSARKPHDWSGAP
jgi:hypothetical protein